MPLPMALNLPQFNGISLTLFFTWNIGQLCSTCLLTSGSWVCRFLLSFSLPLFKEDRFGSALGSSGGRHPRPLIIVIALLCNFPSSRVFFLVTTWPPVSVAQYPAGTWLCARAGIVGDIWDSGTERCTAEWGQGHIHAHSLGGKLGKLNLKHSHNRNDADLEGG